ncbi:hypothetical protein AX17_007057 [Amanita inopinata Kibby_2008]|nr:hypothetical protein AX17_007057 [Amanita inopinata Kibby_2008]
MDMVPAYTSSGREKDSNSWECKCLRRALSALTANRLLPPARLSNQKPSAIFRLRGTFSTSASTSAATNQFSSISQPLPSQLQDVTAILGLAIEPLAEIHQALPTALTKASAPTDPSKDTSVLAERIVKHLFNYVNSFIGDAATSSRAGIDVAIPMSVIAKWYESFMAKVKAGGTAFLERND